ncbi:hypothetical protein F183_A21330 [Bryobacterales bacterium F-183]|nr:hypothetical protein F183_A21330 [Bryobacterales bacterium F-183]
MSESRKPVDAIRVGSIKGSIWKNEGVNGPWYNVTFERLYRENGEWKSSTSFGEDDLLVLAKVADHAHTQLINQKGQG